MTVVNHHMEDRPHCRLIAEAACRIIGAAPPGRGLGRISSDHQVKGIIVPVPGFDTCIVVDTVLGDIVYENSPLLTDTEFVNRFIREYEEVQTKMADLCEGHAKEAARPPGTRPIE